MQKEKKKGHGDPAISRRGVKRDSGAALAALYHMEVFFVWKGIDVSDNQGTINWEQIPKDVDFAIMRSVRRSGKADHQFDANLEGCRECSIPVSVYKYTYAATPEAARQEAQQVVALLQSHGLTGTMVWWDVEDKGVLRPLGVAKLTECIRAAQEVITAAGYGFGLYIGLYVYKERWFDFGAFAGARLWVARYYKGYHDMQFADAPDQNYKPSVDRDITAWQYTSSGEVPGIKGDVDLNLAYEDPALWSQPAVEPGVIWCVSIADTYDKAVAQAVAAAYPGSKTHRVKALDAGGMELWVASVADVWTKEQAEIARQQFAARGIVGTVHRIKILE